MTGRSPRRGFNTDPVRDLIATASAAPEVHGEISPRIKCSTRRFKYNATTLFSQGLKAAPLIQYPSGLAGSSA